MKKTLFTLAAITAATVITAAEPGPVTAILKRSIETPKGVCDEFVISNSHHSYLLSMGASRNTNGKAAPQFMINNPGKQAVPRGIGGLVVNGISYRNINYNRGDMKLWEDKAAGLAGCEGTLNFDGAKVNLRFYMRKDSPMMFVRLTPSKDSVEPIKRISFEQYVCPYLTRDAKIRWDEKSYKRVAVTQKRTLNTPTGYGKSHLLTPEETEIKLFDSEYGKNPGYITFVRDENVLKASVALASYQTVAVQLKPDFKEFTMAYWGHQKIISNAEMEKIIKANPKGFKIK